MTENAIRCPICGSTELIRYGSRPEGACRNCRAKERTRTLYLMLEQLAMFDKRLSVLHFAPEKMLVEKLRQKFGETYCVADIRAEALEPYPDDIHKVVLDLSTMGSLADKRFDVIIHSHVMEHIRSSWQLVFLRLHALLNPGGWHVFAVPILRDWSKEDLIDMTDAQRKRAFGQHDHFRYIGRNDFAIDMQNIEALTGSERLTSASNVLSESDMERIAGDADVYVLRKSSRVA